MAFNQLNTYNATDWAKGDVITEAKLDKIENQLTILTNYAKGLALVSSDSTYGAIVPSTEIASSAYNDNEHIPTTAYINTAINNAIQTLDVNEVTASNIQTIASVQETDGKITLTTQDIALATTASVGLVQVGDNLAIENGIIKGNYVTDSYNATNNKLATMNSISNSIASITASITNTAANTTIDTITQQNGEVSATFKNISIAASQINDIQLVNNYNFASGATNSITAANTLMTLDKILATSVTANSDTSASTTVAITELNCDNGIITGITTPIALATTISAGLMSATDKDIISNVRPEALYTEDPVTHEQETDTTSYVWISTYNTNTLTRSTGWSNSIEVSSIKIGNTILDANTVEQLVDLLQQMQGE